ncbi:hypothetical protein EYF80_024901 [Liparis tanakae]|uniref:Uncharacterized protein n=1 Tax=Liparis tanakae TaxID=230148 RepID=A0A4Z2HIY6_9TELE|nr:hypothetical protein EYF80_024901 [Liparis tanakae]
MQSAQQQRFKLQLCNYNAPEHRKQHTRISGTPESPDGCRLTALQLPATQKAAEVTRAEAEVGADVGTGSGRRSGGWVGEMGTPGVGRGAVTAFVGSRYEGPGSLLLLVIEGTAMSSLSKSGESGESGDGACDAERVPGLSVDGGSVGIRFPVAGG